MANDKVKVPCPAVAVGETCESSSRKKPNHILNEGPYLACKAKAQRALAKRKGGDDGIDNPSQDFVSHDTSFEYTDSGAKIRPDGSLDFSDMKYKDRLKSLEEEIRAGIDQVCIDQESYNQYLDFMHTCYNYSYGNQILIQRQMRFDKNATPESRYKTAKQWQALGYEVNAKFPTYLRQPAKMITVDKKDKKGNVIIGPDGKPEKERIPMGFKSYETFGSHDVYPAPPVNPLVAYFRKQKERTDIEDSTALRQDLEKVAEDNGIKIIYASPSDLKNSFNSISGGTYGFAQKNIGYHEEFANDHKYRIVINKDLPDASVTSTLAHEVGHIICGHIPDPADDNKGPIIIVPKEGKVYDADGNEIIREKRDRHEEEFEAQSFAYAIGRNYGLDNSDESFTYLKAWNIENPDKAHKCLERMSRGLGKFYESLEKSLTGTSEVEEQERINKINKEAAMKRRAEKKAKER